VLAHARFSIVPLRDAEVPCGHVTLVAAMHHAKALVVTDSRGVSDYVRHEHNALLVPAGDPTALATAMLRLWNDPVLCARLGAQGQAFAREHTTEGSTAHYFLGYLNELKLR
jgi:glycosyltransferase involved in cell wall biosynthesis